MIKLSKLLWVVWLFSLWAYSPPAGGTIPPCPCDPNAPEPARVMLFFPVIQRGN